MCPLRYILLLLSAVVAVFGVWQTFRAEDEDGFLLLHGDDDDGSASSSTTRRRPPARGWVGTLWSYCNGAYLLEQWRERGKRRRRKAHAAKSA